MPSDTYFKKNLFLFLSLISKFNSITVCDPLKGFSVFIKCHVLLLFFKISISISFNSVILLFNSSMPLFLFVKKSKYSILLGIVDIQHELPNGNGTVHLLTGSNELIILFIFSTIF